MQGLNLTYGQTTQEKVSICGGLSRGLLDMEEGFLQWEDSPYLNLHQLSVRTKNFVVNYFVNKKTGVIEEMEMLNNRVGKYYRTMVFCKAH